MSATSQPAGEIRRRIVIVEDERQLADLFEMSVRDWFSNVELHKFQNGNEAWAAIEQQEPVLLILDCSHPGLGGIEIVGRLAARKARCLILLTSELFAESLRQHLNDEMNLIYLPKPFGIVQFWKMLNERVGPSDFPERQALVGG